MKNRRGLIELYWISRPPSVEEARDVAVCFRGPDLLHAFGSLGVTCCTLFQLQAFKSGSFLLQMGSSPVEGKMLPMQVPRWLRV